MPRGGLCARGADQREVSAAGGEFWKKIAKARRQDCQGTGQKETRAAWTWGTSIIGFKMEVGPVAGCARWEELPGPGSRPRRWWREAGVKMATTVREAPQAHGAGNSGVQVEGLSGNGRNRCDELELDATPARTGGFTIARRCRWKARPPVEAAGDGGEGRKAFRPKTRWRGRNCHLAIRARFGDPYLWSAAASGWERYEGPSRASLSVSDDFTFRERGRTHPDRFFRKKGAPVKRGSTT